MEMIYKVYYKLNKKLINNEKEYLKSIDIDKIYDSIIKECWKYSIQYELILKNKYVLEIMLYGKRRNRLLKFHKSTYVTYEDYLSFLYKCNNVNIDKAYYISTGFLKKEVINANHYEKLPFKIILEDNVRFISKQMMMNSKHKDRLSRNYIRFYGYIPD